MLINNEFTALNAAFMQAGASSIVATLYTVEDKVSSKIMINFYEGLAQGLRKDEALRQAQLRIREEHPDDPRLWSGFTLSGDPTPVI